MEKLTTYPIAEFWKESCHSRCFCIRVHNVFDTVFLEVAQKSFSVVR